MPIKKFISICIGNIFLSCAFAQSDSSHEVKQIDVFDWAAKFSKHLDFENYDTALKQTERNHFSILPVISYSLQTGMVVGVTGNLALYTTEGAQANISNIISTLAYTQQNQTILIIQPNIWSKGNKYNLVGDIIYLKYPQETYGLGGYTKLSDASKIDYSFIRIYQTVLKQIVPDFFIGMGYNLDAHWNIKETPNSNQQQTDFSKYGLKEQSTSSGISLNILFDNRRNSINPQKGIYGNLVYRNNNTYLGSDNNWQSLIIDFRKYMKFPFSSKNILAFWSYNWLTINGNPPYLDLPSTGWDNYGNTGRGYIQGRFRDKNMIYLESEYRFGITKNGLLGGVLFINTQSFSNWPSNIINNLQPGYGFGLRLKVNKYSNTNAAFDYGFGTGGSRGLFLNLCEMF